MESFIVYDIEDIANIGNKIENDTKYISCSGVKLNNLEWLHSFPNVEKLFMEFCGLTTLNGIENCGQLRELDITGNNIVSLIGIEKCPMLQILDISKNKINNIDSIKQLYYLETVKYSIDYIVYEIRNILNMLNCEEYDFVDNMFEYVKFFSVIDSDMIDYLYEKDKLTYDHIKILLEKYSYKLENTQNYKNIRNIKSVNKTNNPINELNQNKYEISSG